VLATTRQRIIGLILVQPLPIFMFAVLVSYYGLAIAMTIAGIMLAAFLFACGMVLLIESLK